MAEKYIRLSGTPVLDLNARRPYADHVEAVKLEEIAQLDLTTVRLGDWIEYIGTLDITMVAMFNHLGRMGFSLVPPARPEYHDVDLKKRMDPGNAQEFQQSREAIGERAIKE